jgi:RNase P/RNase MRP subunit POP5
MGLKSGSSERIRRRYLLIEAGSKKDVENAILEYIGVLGWARASPVFVDIKKDSRKTVLSVERGEVNNVRAAFEASKDKIKVLRVSGTIKGL